jgi:hypothetical protein
MDSHFNSFPYLFDFNEPMFPNNEVVSKRHKLLQVVIDGEPTSHSSNVYDLKRDLFAVSSHTCNRKVGKIAAQQDSRTALRSYFENCREGHYKLFILHFDEICNALKCPADYAVNRPEDFANEFLSFAGAQDWSPRHRKPLESENDGDDKGKEGEEQNLSPIQKFFNFLKKIFQ